MEHGLHPPLCRGGALLRRSYLPHHRLLSTISAPSAIVMAIRWLQQTMAARIHRVRTGERTFTAVLHLLHSDVAAHAACRHSRAACRDRYINLGFAPRPASHYLFADHFFGAGTRFSNVAVNDWLQVSTFSLAYTGHLSRHRLMARLANAAADMAATW